MTPIRLVDLPRDTWLGIARNSLVVALSGAAVSVVATQVTLDVTGHGVSAISNILALALPLLIGTPFSMLYLARLAQLRLTNQRLEVIASTDGLTSCLNRRAFMEQVAAHTDIGGALLIIDADFFKSINDRFGHDRGDELLQLIVRRIQKSVRSTDLVGRIGGEEFGVFLNDIDLAGAAAIAERIRIAVQQLHFAPDGKPVTVSISIGGATFDNAIAFADLFRVADQRLYKAKQSGRNRIDVVAARPVCQERLASASPNR